MRHATPHETRPPPSPAPHPSTSSHEQPSSRFKWTRERASTAENGHTDGNGAGGQGQGSMVDTALGIALGTALLGCGGIAYFAWSVQNIAGPERRFIESVRVLQVQVECASEDGDSFSR